MLERSELGPSNRFARRFGSKRFLRVRISKRILYSRDNGLVQYFSRPFILDGRVFRAFTSKEHSVYMVETNEQFINGCVDSPGDEVVTADGRISLLAFLDWHNPMHLNVNQVSRVCSVKL